MTTTYAPEPEEFAWLGRAATDIEEANSIEAYFRMRRDGRRAAPSEEPRPVRFAAFRRIRRWLP